MLHILDPDYLKSRTVGEVELLISKIILPPDYAERVNKEDAHTHWDRVVMAHATAVLLPLAAIDILRPAFKAGTITLEKIAELAERPAFAVTLAMSDFLARYSCGNDQKGRKGDLVSKDELLPEQVELRMNNAVRRALNTPPKPLKEVIGKSARATSTKAKSRIKKAVRLEPKEP
jgi:hypothetical protein